MRGHTVSTSPRRNPNNEKAMTDLIGPVDLSPKRTDPRGDAPKLRPVEKEQGKYSPKTRKYREAAHTAGAVSSSSNNQPTSARGPRTSPRLYAKSPRRSPRNPTAKSNSRTLSELKAGGVTDMRSMVAGGSNVKPVSSPVAEDSAAQKTESAVTKLPSV